MVGVGSGIGVAEWGGVAEGVGVGIGVAVGVGVAEGVGIGVAVGVGVAEGVGIGVSVGVGVTEGVGVGVAEGVGSQGYRPRAMRQWKIKVGRIVACSFCGEWSRIDAFSVPCNDGKLDRGRRGPALQGFDVGGYVRVADRFAPFLIPLRFVAAQSTKGLVNGTNNLTCNIRFL